jgi:predicted phosphodiesterase
MTDRFVIVFAGTVCLLVLALFALSLFRKLRHGGPLRGPLPLELLKVEPVGHTEKIITLKRGHEAPFQVRGSWVFFRNVRVVDNMIRDFVHGNVAGIPIALVAHATNKVRRNHRQPAGPVADNVRGGRPIGTEPFHDKARQRVGSRLDECLHEPGGQPGFDIVISGHSHRPRVETNDGVLYLNSGSPGPRRFRLPITLATLDLNDDAIRPELHQLG